MKRKYWDWILIVIIIFMAVVELIRLGEMPKNNESNKPNVTTYSKNKVIVYPIKLTKVTSDDDGNFVVKGTTNAPGGSKILAWIPGDDHTNSAQDPYEDKYAVVRKHKFVATIDSTNMSDKENVKAGDKGRVRIFAVQHYNETFDDGFITHDLQNAVEKQNIKIYKLTYDKRLAKYLKD